MSPMLPRNADKINPANGKPTTASVTVFHVGPRDKDLCALAATDDVPSTEARLQGGGVPIELCERESAAGSWKDVLESVGKFSEPPVLIVASRTADEYLWAEALNLGAYDVLSKPYYPAEVVRVLSMAWLQWMNRRAPAAALAQAC